MKAREIEGLAPEIVTIYRNAFMQPPYNKPQWEVDDFAESLLRQFGRQDFRSVAAFEESGGMVGFAYGYASTANQWWCEAVRPALEKTGSLHWLDESFQFVEIAVDPSAQGKGAGGQLHDELLSGVRQGRAVLSTLQAGTVAHQMYRSRGWTVLCEDVFFPWVVRRYQIMGKDTR